MVREIIIFPDAILDRRCEEVQFPLSADDTRLVHDMVETMLAAKGAGLAAPQVGFSKAIITIMVEKAIPNGGTEFVPLCLINPQITKKTGHRRAREGCLSFPGYYEEVKRSAFVSVVGYDETGAKVEIEASGKLAQALEHEIEHLSGTLFVDHLSPLKRSIARLKFSKAKSKGLRYPSGSVTPQEFTQTS